MEMSVLAYAIEGKTLVLFADGVEIDSVELGPHQDPVACGEWWLWFRGQNKTVPAREPVEASGTPPLAVQPPVRSFSARPGCLFASR